MKIIQHWGQMPAVAGAFLWVGATLTTYATSVTWDADTTMSGAQDGPGIWDASATNWWTGSSNVSFTGAAPDSPSFGAGNATAGTVTLGADVVSGNITFNATRLGNYTIAGGGHILGLTNRTIAANVGATISADVYGGAVKLANSPANLPTGTLTLSGNNHFTGGFTFGPNAANTTGSARAASSQAFGTGTISFNPQGNQTSHRLELIGGINVANPITQQGRNNVSQAFESFAGANTLSGPITFAIGGSEYVVQADGASTLLLSAPTSITMLSSGSRHIVLRGTGSGTVSGILAGGSAASTNSLLDKAGSGIWMLSGANTLAAPTAVSGGTLILDYTIQNNSKLADGHPLYLAGGAVSLNGGTHFEAVSSCSVLDGSSSISSSISSNGFSRLQLGNITRYAGGTLDFVNPTAADTDTSDTLGIIGGYATVGGKDWAHSDVAAVQWPIDRYTDYTDFPAANSVIWDNSMSNVRLNNSGGGWNVTLGSPTTTINTLLQNADDFPVIVDTIGGAGTTLRLGVIGGVLVPPGKKSLTIGTFPGGGTLTAGGADHQSGEIVLINNSANVLKVNATIADNGDGRVSLTKAGSGTATLTAANTYSGPTFVSAGKLNFSSAANLGNGTAIYINGGTLGATASVDLGGTTVLLGPAIGYGGGTISVSAGATLTAGGMIANNIPYRSGFLTAGSLTKIGAGTLALGGSNAYTFGTIIAGGVITISEDASLGTPPGCYMPDNLVLNGGTLEATESFFLNPNRGIRLGPINGIGGGGIAVDDTKTVTFNGQISDNWAGTGSLTKSGTGTLVLGGGVNDYSGDTTVNEGTLEVTDSHAIPNGPGKGNLTLNGELDITLPYYSPGGNVAFNGLSGVGTLNSYSLNSLSVGNNDQSSIFTGSIQGYFELIKTGTGTFTMGGLANTSFTRVQKGVLALSGAANIVSSIDISSGATLDVMGLPDSTLPLYYYQTISGKGSVLGSVDVRDGVLSPGSSPGTLTISSNVILRANSKLDFDLSNVTTIGGGVNDLIIVGGTLTVTGRTVLNLNYPNGTQAASGKYTLFQYYDFVGSVTNIIVPPGYAITNNTVDRTVELIIKHGPANLTWRGDGLTNTWDEGITANWRHNGANDAFYANDTVTFDDTGSSSLAINIAGPVGVNPLQTIVNATKDYIITGYPIHSGSLTKSGTGTLRLDTVNDYNGGTLINGGTLFLNYALNGTGAVVVANGGTLRGMGYIVGPVTVQAGGTLAPGAPDNSSDNQIGYLVTYSSATLAGTTQIELNRNNGDPISDGLWASDLAYGGTLVVSNIGPVLQVNDTFRLFGWAGTRTGTFSTIILPSLYTWDTSQLAVDGTIRVTAVIRPPLSMARTTTNTLAISWPSSPAGFILQENTNSTSLMNWYNVTNAIQDDGTTRTLIVNPTRGYHLFRLKYP